MIPDCQKLIRITDRSEGGWKTALEYEHDELAEDNDDERRIRSAERITITERRVRVQEDDVRRINNC
uniref:Uncharacterized protein n=1 Tax=Romanomermis culicivorax TaxID=13658 RepID=A0A915J193_ROMCU